MFDSYFKRLPNAEHASTCYVSLYVRVPYYGGPEEGGWWGEDIRLVAYQRCCSEEEAEMYHCDIEALNDSARREFGEFCQTQCDWLEARGLDADYLPEVDGPEEYFVVIEDTVGSHCYQGCRHYE